jgi:hypothetical protein
MTIRIAFSAAAMTAVMTQAASAAIVTFTSNTLWSSFSVGQGKTVATENFNSYDGFYAAGAVSGTAGGIQWTASAPSGLYAASGFMSTILSPVTLTFALSPSVQGVAGNFFGTNGFGIVPAVIGVQLADGSSYVGYAASADDFVGFYSTGAAISSISLSASNVSGTDNIFATVNNLYFAVVPAPGAVALIGFAGLIGGSRKRR